MSWLSNILHPEANKASTQITPQNTGTQQLYISVENTRVCFLIIDESTKPYTIVSREEFFLGPIENLEEGKPVRDLFGSLLKFLTNHKDKLENKKSVSVSIPADGVFFRNVEVAKMSETDMQRLVLAELKKTLPIDFSQILLAQNDLGERHEKMRSFFCVGIQKTLFENFKTLFSKFNLNPYFEIEVFSLARVSLRDGIPKLIFQVGTTSSYLIFLEGQIIQDVKQIEIGANDLHKNIGKDLGLSFQEIDTLIKSMSKLQDTGRMGAKILEEYRKDLAKTMAKNITMNILEYEKKQNLEVKEVIISGVEITDKIKKAIIDEFDAELKVDFVNETSFGQFVAENFSLAELKRYAQCFGLALRNK